MKRYEIYKSSEIEWIGVIPNNWKINKFNRVSYMKGRIGWQGLKHSEFTMNLDNPFLITGMNFKDGKIRWDEVYHIAEERYNEAPEIQLQQFDVLMTKDGTIGKLLYIDFLPGKTSLNSHLFVFRPLNIEYFPKYLYYQLQSQPFLHFIELNKAGTTFYGLSQESMGEYKIILPPIKEQTTIANYLDEKTVQIDKLISNKQKLIELLNEERMAMINEAVSGKGKNYERKKLKYLGKVHTGSTPSSSNENFWNGDIIWITPEDLSAPGIFYVEDSKRKITELGLQEIGGELVPECSIILSTRAPIGSMAIAQSPLSFNQGCKAIEVDVSKHHCEYVYYALFSAKPELQALGKGTTFMELSLQSLKDFLISCPSLEEQTSTVHYIQLETQRIDKIVSKIEKEIALMNEYRIALISEVVTGKLDVREHANKKAELA